MSNLQFRTAIGIGTSSPIVSDASNSEQVIFVDILGNIFISDIRRISTHKVKEYRASKIVIGLIDDGFITTNHPSDCLENMFHN
jgi:hypothetical protein